LARCLTKSTALNARCSISCKKTTASTDPMRVLESRTFVRARHVLPRSRAWTRSCGDALASVLASPETMRNRLQKPSPETMRHDGLQTSAARRRLAGSPGMKQTRSPPLARLPAGGHGSATSSCLAVVRGGLEIGLGGAGGQDVRLRGGPKVSVTVLSCERNCHTEFGKYQGWCITKLGKFFIFFIFCSFFIPWSSCFD